MHTETNNSDEVTKPVVDSVDLSESSAAVDLVRDIEIGLKDKLSQEQQSEVIDVVRQIVVDRSATYFSGPQPPPELLAQYEQVAPGWAIRLLEMGEREQIHRIECEKETLALSREELEQDRLWIDYSKTGQTMGFLAFLLVAGIGAFSLYLGKDTIAAVCFGTFGLGIVGLFLKGRSLSPSEKPKP